MEPFVISTHRQLAPPHPLHRLLTPHFQGTLAINEAAWTQLIADKGGVDKLLGGTIQESRRLAADAVARVRFDEILLPATFAMRGVDDVSSFPVYPYRDDSLLYWNAIHHWVDEYTALYYPSDADVAGDVELQAWYTELRSRDGGRVGGLGREPVLGRRDDLIDVLTTVIFTSSVQHAAVNFPQYDLMSYVPNMPLAGYRPAPTSKQGATEADYLNLLPPLDMAELQMNLGYLLGGVRYTTLGDYQVDHFRDPRVAEPLARFQATIRRIGAQIDQRNLQRRRYDFLLPSGIPQSINI
jgi:arachidonate 15-lipoxygenase